MFSWKITSIVELLSVFPDIRETWESGFPDGFSEGPVVVLTFFSTLHSMVWLANSGKLLFLRIFPFLFFCKHLLMQLKGRKEWDVRSDQLKEKVSTAIASGVVRYDTYFWNWLWRLQRNNKSISVIYQFNIHSPWK